MFLQISVILLQEQLGPAFFLPQRVRIPVASHLHHANPQPCPQFIKAQPYDYHPPMPLPDPESPEQALGDCAICMDAIVLEGSQRRRKSADEWGDHSIASGGGGLLNAVQMGVGASGGRKNYSLAPCHHLFVSPNPISFGRGIWLIIFSTLYVLKECVLTIYPQASLSLITAHLQWLAIKVGSFSSLWLHY